MTVHDTKKFQVLSDLLNTSFGKSGTKPYTTQSLQARMLDDKLMKVNFMMIVNFSSDGMMFEMTKRFKNEGLSMVKAKLDRLKEEYKDKTDETVSFKLIEATVVDSYEFLSNSLYNPKKTAYYRLSCQVEVK